MIDIPKQKNVSSDEAIINSIIADDAVSRWFELLTAHPQVQAQLRDHADAVPGRRRLRSIIFAQRILFTMALALALTVIVRDAHQAFFSIPAVLIIAWAFLQSMKRKTVAAISAAFILSGCTRAALADITLYQLAEQYSRKYGIPSLVDKITASSRIMRYSILLFITAYIALSASRSLVLFFIMLILFYLTARIALIAEAVYPRLK